MEDELLYEKKGKASSIIIMSLLEKIKLKEVNCKA